MFRVPLGDGLWGLGLARGLDPSYILQAQRWNSRTMPKSSAEVIAELERAGWREVRQKGSHKHFRHRERSGTTTVPHPRKDLDIKIERQSGVKLT